MAIKRWVISDGNKELSRSIAEKHGLPPFAAHLLVTRGIISDEDIDRFINADSVPLGDPFELADMDKAVERVERAIESFEPIAIFGDYDVDGVTSTALLYEYLCSREANVTYMLPSRDEEGYGLHRTEIERLAAQGIKLIITVDNGISSVDEAEYAKSLGVEMVVTDHHAAPPVIPDVCAVVDPKRKDRPGGFTELAGVGVAYKLVCALERGVPEGSYTELVALGTIADVVSVTGENRTLVIDGLRRMREGCRTGIDLMLAVAGMTPDGITAVGISFGVAPKINAAGRMGKPDRAVRLMLSKDVSEARGIARELSSENDRRRIIEDDIIADAWNIISSDPSVLYDRVVVICGEGWHSGVMGLAAGRLSDRLGKPCIVLCSDGETAVGSGRCFGDFSMFDALQYCSSLMIATGGHKSAGGLSLLAKNVPEFRRMVNEYAESFSEMPVPELRADCVLPLRALSVGLVDDASVLEPFGADNPEPVICVRGVKIISVIPMGGGKHHRLTLSDGVHNVQTVFFNSASGTFPRRVGDVVDCLMSIGKSRFRNAERLELHIKDIRLSSCDVEGMIRDIRLYDKYMRGEPLSNEERAALTPTRDQCASVYGCALAHNCCGTPELLASRLAEKGVTYAKLRVALDALSECGALSVSFGRGVINAEPQNPERKKRMEDTEVIKGLALHNAS